MKSPARSNLAEHGTPGTDDLELMKAEPEHLRDRLTVEHLLAFARSIDPHARPIAFERNWWDGSATSNCLLVEMPGRRHRVVSTGGGTPMLLPARPVSARRVLSRSRRSSSEPLPAGSATPSDHVMVMTPPVSGPRPTTGDSWGTSGQAQLSSDTPERAHPTLPQARPSEGRRTVVQDGDYTVCRYADCGGLIPIDAGGTDHLGSCPMCARN